MSKRKLVTVCATVGFLTIALATHTVMRSAIPNIEASSRTTDQVNNSRAESTEIPAVILWSAVLGIPKKLDAAASKARASGESDALWNDFFIRQVGLSAEADHALRAVASRYEQASLTKDEELKAISERLRGAGSQAQTSSDETRPLFESISKIQEQRERIVSEHREQLKNSLGDAAFETLSHWVNDDFSKKFRMTKESLPLPGRSGSSNGFTPFENIDAAKRRHTGGVQ